MAYFLTKYYGILLYQSSHTDIFICQILVDLEYVPVIEKELFKGKKIIKDITFI